VTLEVTAEAGGRLHILVAAGTTVKIGAVVGSIDTISAAAAAEIDKAGAAAEPVKQPRAAEPKPPVVEKPPTPATAAPAKPAPPGVAETREVLENLPPSVRRLWANTAWM